MRYSINFLDSEGHIIYSITDYFINQASLICFIELMMILHSDIEDYVIV